MAVRVLNRSRRSSGIDGAPRRRRAWSAETCAAFARMTPRPAPPPTGAPARCYRCGADVPNAYATACQSCRRSFLD